MGEVVLECKKLNKKFGKKQVLKDVSFSLEEGDILGFIGPNGAGKTTTIKLILGLQSINSGSVTINGFDIEKNYVKAIERVGAIVENPDMYMYLSGRENLEMIARLYKNISKERIEEVIKISGLGKRIDDKVNKYSLGMRQRLGIAAAIIHKPNILVLDEPTNGLDPEGIKEVRELLVKLTKEENICVLISSHNLAELDNFCTKVCMIQNGVIIESGDIKKLKKQLTHSAFIIEMENTDGISDIVKDAEVYTKGIKVRIEREKVPALIKKLVKNDYSIYSVYEMQISLEEAFLEKTGGNTID